MQTKPVCFDHFMSTAAERSALDITDRGPDTCIYCTNKADIRSFPVARDFVILDNVGENLFRRRVSVDTYLIRD